MNPFNHLASGAVPSVFVQTVRAEMYAQPAATKFKATLDAAWRSREDARLGRLARLTRKHGPRGAALRVFAREWPGTRPREPLPDPHATSGPIPAPEPLDASQTT